MKRPWSEKRVTVTCSILALLGTRAALGKGSFSDYNFGVYYALSSSYTNLEYDAPLGEKLPKDCVVNTDLEDKMRCRTYLVPNNSKGFGLFLQKPSKKQGFLYFEPGFTWSTLSYSYKAADSNGSSPDGSTELDFDKQPLQKVQLELYGINGQGYLKFGITPNLLPDIFLSLGLGLQTVGGRVKVVHTDQIRWVLQPSAFAEIEVVPLRLATGYLSLFMSQDQTILGRYGTNLIEDYPNGSDLSNFKATLINGGFGARLLLPF
jgi:hypothetical protein